VHRLTQSVLKFIRKHDQMRPGNRVGIAVSGGADSVALLRISLELRDELGTVLSVVHLNHKIRSEESDADEEFVRVLAQGYGLPFINESTEVVTYAAEKKLGTEAAARRLRYGFFHRLLSAGAVDKIATAHTLDDQAETVLLKLMRGAGTRGLAGLFPKLGDQAAIVRPMMAVRRVEIEAYLQELKQGWREDSSNRDWRHTRNRIRHHVVPDLEKYVNPRVKEALAEAAEIARLEEEFWAEQIQRALPQVWQDGGEGCGLNLARLQQHPMAMQRRLVRAAGEKLRLNLEFRHVEEVLALTREGGRTALPEDWIASIQNGSIVFRHTQAAPEDYAYELLVPGVVRVPAAGVMIEAEVVESVNSLPGSACLISRDFAGELIVRNWRPGDRFWPAHTKEPRKVKELLQDRRITGPKKRLWPVISRREDVLWVRGMGVAPEFQPKDGQAVLIRETEVPGAGTEGPEPVSAPNNAL
jgi:tRNA(Ile)-lysidine synthase